MSVAHRILQGFVALTMFGVLGLAALLAALWVEHKMPITLPTPTGPFAVGRAIYDWVDDAMVDKLAPVAGTKRELLVWIWYPSVPGQPGATTDDYVPAPFRAAAQRARGAQRLPGLLMSNFLTRDASKVHSHSI